MALSDPLVITLPNDSNLDLNRVSVLPTGATYDSLDGEWSATISHSKKKRNRSVVRLTHTKTVPDELSPNTNVVRYASMYTVIDRPLLGYDADDLGDIASVFATVLNNVNFAKIISGQS